MSARFLRIASALVLIGRSDSCWLHPDSPDRCAGQPSTRNGEWPHYTADIGAPATRRSIRSTANFSKLEVAWRFKTDNLGPRPSTSSKGRR